MEALAAAMPQATLQVFEGAPLPSPGSGGWPAILQWLTEDTRARKGVIHEQGQRGAGFGAATAAAVVVANMIGTGVFTSLGFQLVTLNTGFALIALWVVGLTAPAVP